MSVSFTTNCQSEEYSEVEPCLCAQMASCFSEAFENKSALKFIDELKAEANPNCPFCKGTGLENSPKSDAPELNLANRNFAVLYDVLGLKKVLGRDFDYVGEMTLAQAKRALMFARNHTTLKNFEIAEELIHGKPQNNEDGSVELRPLRHYDQGLSNEKLQSYIDRFAAFLQEVEERGGDMVYWG